jgi:hypothetical protein
MPRIGQKHRGPLVKTIKLILGDELQLFRLDKESLMERKEAMQRVKALREMAKSFLVIDPKPALSPSVAFSFPDQGLEDIDDPMEWDDFQEIDNELPAPFPRYGTSGKPAVHSNKSVMNQTFSTFQVQHFQ